jgi:hypothetical protein
MTDTDTTDWGVQDNDHGLLTADPDHHDTVQVREIYSGGVFTAYVRDDGVVREHEGDHAAGFSDGAYELVNYDEPDADGSDHA